MSENPFTDGQQFSAARLNSMYNAHQNEGVLSGLGASTSTNAFDVDVASGELFLNNDVVSVGSATLSLSTSDPEDRIDLISADSTGLTVTQGNPAATSGQPIAPDIPSGDVLVSLIYVRGGSTEILTGDIFNDYRVELQSISPALIDQSLPGDLDESFFNHSGLANIQRDSHHTPVVFEFNPHPYFFAANTQTPPFVDATNPDPSQSASIQDTGVHAGFIGGVSITVQFINTDGASSQALTGTLNSIEIFNAKTSNWVTLDTPNFGFGPSRGSTATYSQSYNYNDYVSAIRANYTVDDSRGDRSVRIDGDANVQTPVFE